MLFQSKGAIHRALLFSDAQMAGVTGRRKRYHAQAAR